MYSYRVLFAWGMYIKGSLCIKIVLYFLTGMLFTQSTQTSKRSTHVTYSFCSNFNFCSIKHVLSNFQSCFIFQNYPRFFSLDMVAIFFPFETNSSHPILRFFSFLMPTTSSAREICFMYEHSIFSDHSSSVIQTATPISLTPGFLFNGIAFCNNYCILQ